MASLKYWDGAAWVPIGLGPAQAMDPWHQVGAVGEPAFQNAWVNYGGGNVTLAFTKNPFGRVQLRGLVRAGTLNAIIFTLPPGYRPTAAIEMAVEANAGANLSRVVIDTSGNVMLYGASNLNWSLTGLEFDTDTVTTWAPAAVAQDASTTQKGSVQLAGDLAGTAALPTVPKLASGNYSRITRNSNAAAGNDYTVPTSAAVYTAIDSTNLRITRSCSGRPVRVHLRGVCANNVAMGSLVFQLRMDGAVVDGGPSLGMHSAVAGQQIPLNIAWDITPSIASHFFEPWWTAAGTSATGTLYCRSNFPVQFVVEELPYG